MPKKQPIAVSFFVWGTLLMAEGTGLAADARLIDFDSAPVPMSGFQQRLARERGETKFFVPGVKLQGYLRKPDGDGPFPAVVFLHGVLGLDEATKTILPTALAKAGYVTLVVDSFATRGDSSGISPLDAYGALIHLSQVRYVDRERVAVVGNSFGGDAALSIAQPSLKEPFFNPEHLQFKAAVAFSPRCNSDNAFTIPALVLAAERDQRSNPRDCLRMFEKHAADISPLKIVVYPGVHNGFQSPEFSPGRVVQEYFREYDAPAAAQATAEMTAFLRATLRQ
jgi:dienelactone hydrolase